MKQPFWCSGPGPGYPGPCCPARPSAPDSPPLTHPTSKLSATGGNFGHLWIPLLVRQAPVFKQTSLPLSRNKKGLIDLLMSWQHLQQLNMQTSIHSLLPFTHSLAGFACKDHDSKIPSILFTDLCHLAYSRYSINID